jgi:histidyl-tRNA synthetase
MDAMTDLRPVRGTHDIVGEEALRHRQVVETGRAVAARYGYHEVATPVFEFTEVFARTLGETSDVVTKEMYTFEDRGGDSLTLRPEYTAGIARAFISGSLGQQLPIRLFASGPMFRYERPQKGRLRQFHQIDVEILGAAEPLADVEVIALGARILSELGLAGQVVLELNSLGDQASRRAYRDELVGYLARYRGDLSADSRDRLERNPLRILDSKDPHDREILIGAPSLADSLNEASRAFFAEVRVGLDALGLAYRINPALVRGLDYYTHTAFEFTTTALGAQGAVLAGGRYDGLIATMGGPDTPGIGWAAGVERLAMLLDATPALPRPVAVVPIGENTTVAALQLAEELRSAGHHVEFGLRGKVGQRLKRAAQQNARYAILLGEDELRAGKVMLRDLDRGEQHEVARTDLGTHLLAEAAA